jgi:hypothetical protein
MGKFSLARLCVVTAVAAFCSVAPAAAADTDPSPGKCDWQMRYLERGDSYQVTGSNGRGGFSGNAGDNVATWINDKVRIHPLPTGYNSVQAIGQNSRNTIAGTATAPDGNKRAVVLNDDTYWFLSVPDGYFGSTATAINSRGDVAGSVDSVPVVWPSEQATPVLIESDVQLDVADIDDDGTVLLNGLNASYLWKDGVLTKLAIPDGYWTVGASELRAGKVVGLAWMRFVPQGLVWFSPADYRPLAGSMGTYSINSAGLISGWVRSPGSGPPAVWFAEDPTSAEQLPTPPGTDIWRADHVSDDGQVVANTMGAVVVWKCHPKA